MRLPFKKYEGLKNDFIIIDLRNVDQEGLQMQWGNQNLHMALCDRHGLRVRDLGQLVSWAYGDGLFGVTWDDVSAMEKARRLGFEGREDNGEALLRILAGLRRDRIVP